MLSSTPLLARISDSSVGQDIHALSARIYPICRSITGDGVRETLGCLKQHIDLQQHEVPTGTRAFDWDIPREWNIRDAYIKNAIGERVVDFHASNLHVVSYSVPVRGLFSLEELRPRIFTLPEQPDLIPYRTSYYKEDWGFCMAHRRLQALPEGPYEVLIDSTLRDGSLTYGEYIHHGMTDEEVILSAHICHPSLANDNCSGVALLTCLAERLRGIQTRYSYRFIFAPGTIGAIVWLSRNEHLIPRIAHGLIISGVGDPGRLTYKRSRRSDAQIDRVMAHVLRHSDPPGRIVDFSPYGYDERQYCSPGFNLSVGLVQRSPFGTFPEYHTSGDNLELITAKHLADSYAAIAAAVNILENDTRTLNKMPKCEPQLGRRGLYASAGGGKDGAGQAMPMLWVLNFSDQMHSLLEIAERANMPFETIRMAAEQLGQHGLIEGAPSTRQEHGQSARS